jgi:cytochrome bd-type quinol oxidase subunit 1
MSNNQNTPNLGNVITNPGARKVVYGAYAIGAFIIGGISAYFLGIGQPIPEIVTGAQAVAAYVGIGVGGLALANTPASA